MNDNVDGFFITRAETEYLAEKLDTIPSLELEMTIALTSQARISDGPSTSRPKPGSRPPYPIHLEHEVDLLRNELTTVARDMCEARGLEYDGGSSCTGVSKWLKQYRYALALMPQAPELFDGLCKRIDHCARTMNHIKAEYVIDEKRVEAANRTVVSTGTIEPIARRLGDLGKGLNARRIRTLCKHAGLEHVSEDDDTGMRFYRLGDVIEAHKRHKRRA